ncbi:hypothetical protein EES43_24605 [Streptomyces sp. ADI96-02]|uniref:hypothetical protein n=1 Tax=Streptomyces sp. ADI96-02 TaxID=1522760 RepID=UPI000F551534|nr:hypothetical protein [Streptomyces sp. ADI96-02]RPK56227.1 hypothetical protein EES43_24605 [Streptomyces sp. ADI96-02]
MPYATVPDLAAWLAPEPAPSNAVRLLTLASQRVDRALLGAWYDRDDAEVLEVLRQATVQQVHWMLERGDETEAESDLQSMSTGQRSFSKRALRDGEQPQRLASAVGDLLRTCGLFRFDPLVVG